MAQLAERPHERLGQLLLRGRVIDEAELESALDRHMKDGVRLGEALVSAGAVTHDDVWRALAMQWGLELHDVRHAWVDRALANELDAREAISHGVLPIRAAGGTAVVAMPDPRDEAAVQYAQESLGMPVRAVMSSPAAIHRIQQRVYRQQLVQLSSGLLHATTPEYSAHVTMTHRQKQAAWLLGALVVAGFVVLHQLFFVVLTGAIVTLYAAVVLFRTYVTVRGTKSEELIKVDGRELARLQGLPTYTILCPLYREAGVLPQLLKACSEIDYPGSKLDIKLLVEEDDAETLEVVRAAYIPPNFDVLVVPAEGPRTKPKACNYGLMFARGEYTVIYDAEDIPERDQLRKAIAVFRRSDANVGCVQAKLNYYNPRQNVITRWFALEYTSWFDFFLPGLVALRLPVPLGGSSNHFPTELLRRLGGWDPNNVTEDADLGMRLNRAGFQTALMDSTTLEEANSDFVNWMRQRSRWGKGYFVSWLVLVRHPIRLWKDVGWRGYISMNLMLGGTFGVALLNLLVWMLTLLWALAQFQIIGYWFPTGIYYIGMLELIFGNFYFMYMAIWCAYHRKQYDLTHAAMMVPAYWLMASLAMIKAAIQTATRPGFWEKTVHGLFETGGLGAARSTRSAATGISAEGK